MEGQSKVPPLYCSLDRCTRKTSHYCVPPSFELVGGCLLSAKLAQPSWQSRFFEGQSKVLPLYSFLDRCTRKTSEIISLYCVPPPIELVGGAFTKRAAHTLQLLSVNISPSLPQPPAFLPRLSNTLALVLEFHPSNSSSSRSRLWWLSSHNVAKT